MKTESPHPNSPMESYDTVGDVPPHRTDEERAWLVRFCAALSGNSDVAEDLAHDVLMEAWKHEASLRDPAKRSQWLAGIARNLWRRRLRERQRVGGRVDGEDTLALVPDSVEVELELERAELALLLDRALALLPAETRDVLVGRFVEEMTHAELAERLRLSEGTVKVRVHRGKLALKRLLNTHFATDLEPYGFLLPGSAWKETQVWCMYCGAHRLLMRVSESPRAIEFRCEGCHPGTVVPTAVFLLTNPTFAGLFCDLTRPATIIKRAAEWSFHYYCELREGRVAPCTVCGRPATVLTPRPEEILDALGSRDGMYVWCDLCGTAVSVSRQGLVLDLPQVREFVGTLTRVQTRSSHRLDSGGRPAVVTSISSRTSSAKVDVLTDEETFQVLGLYRASERGVDV